MKRGTEPPWLRDVRRTDRRIADTQAAWEILKKGLVCHVAFCAEGWPYVVPMSYGILDGKLYFHCARAGTRLELLHANANVCFEVETDVDVVSAKSACESSVRYRSVIGFGHAAVVTDSEERRAGLKALSERYYGGDVALPREIGSNAVVLRIDVGTLTAKGSIGPSASDESSIAA